MAKILFFDVETTGLNSATNAIHQLSGTIEVDGIEKQTFNLFIQPHSEAIIVDDALKVSNVTKEKIMSYPESYSVYLSFVHMLSIYCNRYDKTDKIFLAGYNNLAFDNNFLRAWFAYHGDKYFGAWFWSNSIDCFALATPTLMAQRSKMIDFKLMTVAKTLGCKIDESKLHNAEYDIHLTRWIYYKILFGIDIDETNFRTH